MDKLKDSSEEFSFIGLIAFLAVVSMFLFVSTKAGTRAVGMSLIVWALLQLLRGRIEYGWEGRPPLGYITGWPATVLNVIFGALGFAIVSWPEVAMGIFGWDGE